MIISVLLYACLALTVDASTGAPECPCITNSSANFALLEAALLRAGLSKLYGTTGCKAHDENNSLNGCSSNQRAACLNPWCYVDTELCSVNSTSCLAAGGQVGSDVSPYCRKRDSYRSGLDISNEARIGYSYETCGSLLDFNAIAATPPAGEVVKIAVATWAPWVVTKASNAGLTRYGGAVFDFFLDTLGLFEPMAILHIVPGWATAESRAMFSSSYTACVHDVAVGVFDMCVADLWITPDRLQMSEFTPPVRYDSFYLVVPRKYEDTTFGARLGRPLDPLTGEAWIHVGIYLTCISVALVVIRMWDFYDGHFRRGCRAACKYMARESCLTFFDVHHNFLTGSPHQGGPESMANMVLKTALAVFALIILASYTASLASILVTQEEPLGQVSDLGEAIGRQMKVCCPGVVEPAIKKTYPDVQTVPLPATADAPRFMYSGKCDVAIVTEGALALMHAGQIRETDCSKVANGQWTEAEAHCREGFSGKDRNDYDLMRVGEVLASMPVGFPVNPKYQHVFHWAILQLSVDGVFDEKVQLNRGFFPRSQCAIETKSEEDGLDFDNLSGTFMICYGILLIGVVLFACQVFVVITFKHEHGDIFTWLQEEVEELEGIKHNSNEDTPSSTLPSASENKQSDESTGAERHPAHGEEDSRYNTVMSRLDDLCILVQNLEDSKTSSLKSADAIERPRRSLAGTPQQEQQTSVLIEDLDRSLASIFTHPKKDY